jgi:hypothetical protein
VFSDKAAILVGEHRGYQRVSRTPEERFHPDVIEVRYNNHSEAMLLCFGVASRMITMGVGVGRWFGSCSSFLVFVHKRKKRAH